MSWMKHTGSRYHNQDTGYYCGAAAAMMVLSEIGVPYSDLDQDDLYDSNHDHNAKTTGWATDPYGLRYTLIDRRPAGFNQTFVVHKPTTEAQGTRDIVYTLHKYGVSPAALVYGCAHWIVVPGVQTDVEPVSGSNYTVEGFWLHNPVHHAGSPPPPHSATDNCGSGGTQGDANEWVTYADWQTTYFTGCNYDHPAGSPQFISVCDPDVRNIELPHARALRRLAKGDKLVTSRQVLRFQEAGLEELRLRENRIVREALARAQPGKPQLVTRLDRRNAYYYIVPWETARTVRAFSRVDARFGTLDGLHVLEKPVSREFLSRESVKELVAHRRFELADRFETLRVFPETVCYSPTLVWMPCWESWSPNLPFYQLTVGGHTLYVRIDGEVFTSLTRNGSGT